MSVKDGMNAEQVAAAKRDEARRLERQHWAELYHIYERCVEIAQDVWADRLDAAQATQHQLAKEMRDRGPYQVSGTPENAQFKSLGEIPVPLFTPRDRQQFVKEVAATLLISADRRNLTVQFPKELPPENPSVEAASGVDEGPGLDLEAAHLSAQTE